MWPFPHCWLSLRDMDCVLSVSLAASLINSIDKNLGNCCFPLCLSVTNTISELESCCLGCVWVWVKLQYTKTDQADWAGIISLACQPWRPQTHLPSPLQHEIQGCRGDLVSWSKAKQGIAWLAITGNYTQTRRRFPSYLPLAIMLLLLLLPRVHKQYFHQRPPQTLPRDLSGCWSRKWIFYSSLAWSITYKLLLYFVTGQRERL